jgi:Tol biopolymer transport system component/predicted Ser/Thr protein kinase
MIGQTLDHYRIESKLGEGGMGVVYKAHDTYLDRAVAIKVLPPGKVADADRKQRFVQEARAASALNHPSIVTIYDIRSHEGMDFIVMEYLDGQTLDALIPSKGMRAALALKYAVQIADALAKAHGAGIIHRDLKPSNVMVTEDGRVKILDFGLAKLAEAASSPEGATVTERPITEEGTVLGTVAYMSPEQAEGRKLDARSDIFSFGSVLYEMVTGRKPFSGDSRLALLTKILNEDPAPPSKLASAIPTELEKIILQCLRKDPARRFQHMADLKVALEDVDLDSSAGQQAVSAAAPSRWRWGWAGLLPVLLVGAGYFGWQAWRATRSAEPLRAVALTTLPGAELYPSFSPDGNHVAFAWTGPKQDNRDIYAQMIGAGSPLRLTTDPRSDFNPVWSPDGRWMAFLRGEPQAGRSELRLVPPLGGPERKLAEIWVRELFGNPGFVAWCPDANCLVVTDSPGEGKPDALFVVSLETGEKRRLTNPQPPVVADTSPAISPDGRSLVFRRNFAWQAGELHQLTLERDLTATGESRRLTPSALNSEYPAWMPDGKEVLFSARGSLWRLAVSGENTPARLPFVGDDGLMPVVSRPQPGRPLRLVYVRSFTDRNIWRVETSATGAPASSPPVVSISSTKADIHPQFSPDGRRVAFTSNRLGDMAIWVSDPDGSNAVKLTSFDAQSSGFPRWSPDSQLITFDSNLEGQIEIYVVPAAGGKPRRLTSHPANDHVPSFSRDGKWIYFGSNRTGEHQIWKIPASGGDAVQVTHNGGYVAFEALDGAFVYYTQTSIAASTLWRLPTSGGQPVKVVEGVVWRAFVVLARGIYYIDPPSSETRLQFFDFATGRSTTVARNLGEISGGLAASPDGRTILYSRVDSSVDELMLVENFR